MDSGSAAFDPESEQEFQISTAITAEETIWLMDELLYREVRIDSQCPEYRITLNRLPGTWDILSPKHFSHRYTLNDCCGQSLSNSLMLAFTGTVPMLPAPLHS